MWQRFTERARRVILLAQEEAGELRSEFVGTEHLLLGLLSEDEGVAGQVLRKMNVSLNETRKKIRAQSDQSPPSEGEPKLTPQAKRILELAADEAREMRHNYIGTEHLLLALLRERDGLAARTLRDFGLNIEQTRSAIMEYLGTAASTREADEESENRALRHENAVLKNKLREVRDQSGGAETLALRHEIAIKKNENAMLRERLEMLRQRLASSEEKRAPDENA